MQIVGSIGLRNLATCDVRFESRDLNLWKRSESRGDHIGKQERFAKLQVASRHRRAGRPGVVFRGGDRLYQLGICGYSWSQRSLRKLQKLLLTLIASIVDDRFELQKSLLSIAQRVGLLHIF